MTRHRSRAHAKRSKQVKGPSAVTRQAAKAPPPDARAAAGSRAWAMAPRLIPLVLLGAGLGAYINSFDGSFVFDDSTHIINNPQIRHLWPPWEVMGNNRPLVQLSLAVNYALGGLSVWGYHAFNLTVHLLAGLTLFALVRQGRVEEAIVHFAEAVRLDQGLAVGLHREVFQPLQLSTGSDEHRWLIEGLWGDQAVGIVGGEPSAASPSSTSQSPRTSLISSLPSGTPSSSTETSCFDPEQPLPRSPSNTVIRTPSNYVITLRSAPARGQRGLAQRPRRLVALLYPGPLRTHQLARLIPTTL